MKPIAGATGRQHRLVEQSTSRPPPWVLPELADVSGRKGCQLHIVRPIKNGSTEPYFVIDFCLEIAPDPFDSPALRRYDAFEPGVEHEAA